ncbi:MAG: acylphosphatase [Candidatus Thermoplasmatota archaeon]
MLFQKNLWGLPSCARLVARAHVFVSGKVQGVFYRDSTRSEAQKRGVRGWVRNLRDGRVEAVFEGATEDVEAMVAWCRIGPALSRPTFVDRKSGEAEEGFTVFEIRSTG